MVMLSKSVALLAVVVLMVPGAVSAETGIVSEDGSSGEAELACSPAGPAVEPLCDAVADFCSQISDFGCGLIR
jgi:hypothetical protein